MQNIAQWKIEAELTVTNSYLPYNDSYSMQLLTYRYVLYNSIAPL